MKIALIHCPFEHRDFSENLRIVDEEFCHAPPIILAYVAAILEGAGHEVIIVEANILKLTKEKVLDVLRHFSPDLIGFRADTYWFHRVVEWASFFKARMDVKVIVGGINVTLYPKESLSYDCFDYGISGEANESLPQLLQCLKKGGDPGSISGLVYRSGQGVVVNPCSEKKIPFDDYPFPARHLLPNHLYSSFTSQRKNYTVMLTSTGCPFGCSFCAISRQFFRHRSVRSVIKEVECCCREYQVREIDFFAPSFFVHREFVLEFCREMIKEDFGVEWSCRSRVDQVDQEVLRLAHAAGCRKIYYGIESVSPDVLQNIAKDINVAQIREAIRWTHEAGISTLGFFMLGNPGDTRESILASIDFAKELQLDYVQVCRTVAKPDTVLNDLMIEKGGKDVWRNFLLEQGSQPHMPTPWTSLSREELDGYVRLFYQSFYFRPAYIVKRLLKLRSPEELFRFMWVAARWLVVRDLHKK
ncbi:MAG: radical SAM protein [Candidatus Omnitrophota bacterium]